MYRKKNIALALSGGGARGLAHIGAIEELEARGYTIRSIAGTSMGSLVGGFYAAGKMEEFKDWMFTLDKRKVFGLVDFTLSREGLVKGDKVFNAMKEIIPEMNIEDLKIPYAAVAVDLVENREIVFKSGSLYDAIRASISIPNVFTPVKRGEKVLVDGGVLNNLPLNHVERKRRDLLVAVNVNAHVPLQRPEEPEEDMERNLAVYQKKLKEFYDHLPKLPKKEHSERFGYFEQINKSLALMTGRIAELTLELYPPDILINVSRESCGTYDFYKAEEVVENGRYAARLVLDQWEK